MDAARSRFALPLLLLLAACGPGRSGDDANGGAGATVRADGSSTVFPLTEAVAEEFMRENAGTSVTVGSSGTGGGFSKFVRQETDISNASRPIKAEEIAEAEANGVAFIELPVAYDGLAIMVHPSNTFAECLTVEELKAIWEPGSTVNNWSQVRAGFPDQRLSLYGPGTDSGTYDYFTAAIGGEEGASRTDFQASEDDNMLVQGIAGDPNALGYFGLAYYENNRENLKLVAVDDGDEANGAGCITPSPETVQNGTYQPLARPEFIYVSVASAESNPTVQSFVEFYLERAGALATEVGSVPLSDEAYALVLERFRARTPGSVFSGGSQVGVRIEDLLRMEGSGADSTGAAGTAPAAGAQDSAAAPR